jgi:alcohol dehydrogenase
MRRADSAAKDGAMTDTYRSMQADERGGTLHLVERELREPGPGQARIAVDACGVCQSDALFIAGAFPDTQFPLVPGHEIAGRIDALGEGVEGFEVGQRVAVGWFGGNCGRCNACRDGDAINCTYLKIPGLSYQGGFADSVIVPSSALARMPEGFPAAEAGPMACAGVTVYNGLRRTGARPGDLVAVVGIGGLGHLGVQFARAMGFETVAIDRGTDKEAAARELGAHHYIDGAAEDVPRRLSDLGGARAVLATANSALAATATLGGLTHRGELVMIGIPADPLTIPVPALIGGTHKINGHASGTSREVEETLRFAALSGVRPVVEEVPLTEAVQAMDKMASGAARFRMVLTPGR